MASTTDEHLRKANQFRISVLLTFVVLLFAGILGFQKFRAWRFPEDEITQAKGNPRLNRNPGENGVRKLDDPASSEATQLLEHQPNQTSRLLATGSLETNASTHPVVSTNLASAGLSSSPGWTRSNEMDLVIAIHRKIVANSPEKTAADMRTYDKLIPGVDATLSMVAIPAGEFVMGSPEIELKRQSDEGPEHLVRISPLWVQRFEVTWNQYEAFMFQDRKNERIDESDLADAVAVPSKPYVEMSFGMGRKDYPAISMTQHGANKFCQWLSAKMGHFYRLPTEAEWEFACRAGTRTAFSFGNDPAGLDDYAWFADNSGWKYQKVGRKKPNGWGLHDMHGNVAEWCLDQYAPYPKVSGAILDPWNKARQPYPHVVRGGSWEDDSHKCRSAARRGSDPGWKIQDPMLPKSVWFHTDAQFVGFRVVRPLRIPSPQEMYDYWNSGVELDPQ